MKKLSVLSILILLAISCDEENRQPISPPVIDCPEHTLLDLQRYFYQPVWDGSNHWQNKEGDYFRYYVALNSTGFFRYNDTLAVSFSIEKLDKCSYKYNLSINHKPGGYIRFVINFESDVIDFYSPAPNIMAGKWTRVKP